MFKAPIINIGQAVVMIMLTDYATRRHTVLVSRQTIKIVGEGPWLRNSH